MKESFSHPNRKFKRTTLLRRYLANAKRSKQAKPVKQARRRNFSGKLRKAMLQHTEKKFPKGFFSSKNAVTSEDVIETKRLMEQNKRSGN